MKTFYLDPKYGRMGNNLLLFSYLYYLYDNFIIYCDTNDSFLNLWNCRELFKFYIFDINSKPSTLILDELPQTYIFISGNLWQIHNWDKLRKNLNINFEQTNNCVISCRFGNYLDDFYKNTYRSFDNLFFDNIIYNYSDKINDCEKIFVISDDLYKAHDIIGDKINDKSVTYYNKNIIKQLNLLFNAKVIVSSCSTFPLAAAAINPFNPTILCEYPYYKRNNPHNYKETLESSLYDFQNMIKIDLGR